MILVTGANGFVGRHVVETLRAENQPVRALVRDARRAAGLAERGCELLEGDIAKPATAWSAVDGVDAVVHLVSIIAGRPRDFERVMVEATRQLCEAAVEHGVGRFVLMSALGTSEATRETVPYYRSKWAMEQAVAASGIPSVVLRPGFVFGHDGGVLPGFVRQVRVSPLVPVAGAGERRLQPIWVEDLADATARALDSPAALGRTLELGGSDVVTWNELFARIARSLGRERRLVHVPLGVARTGARLAELLPKPPVTRDMLTMLELGDNVCDPAPANEALGLAPIGLDEMLARAIGKR